MSKTNKTTYKVDNWSEYNQALRQRGNLDIWLGEDIIDNWYYDGPTQQGAQPVYSDCAIGACLSLRLLLSLPFRQTQGFVTWLFRMMEIDLDVPDYSLLSRRKPGLSVPNLSGQLSGSEGETIHILIDSSGLKVYGESEWKRRTHGRSKRRTWRKLHLGVSAQTGLITAAQLTGNEAHDSSQTQSLLQQTLAGGQTISHVSGDSGYDTWDSYKAIAQADAVPIIPPRKNAKIKKHGNAKGPPLARDEAIRYIRRHGRAKWKRDHHYHQRSRIEATMRQFKTLIGPKLRARKLAGQKVEARIGCKILNQMMRLGMPQSHPVANG